MNYLRLDNIKCNVLQYSPLNSTVILKVIQSHWKRLHNFLLMFNRNYGSIKHHFWHIRFKKIL